MSNAETNPVTFINRVAQGDVFFKRVNAVPTNATPAAKSGGDVVVAHSETGHHHSFARECGVTYYTTQDPFICYLSVETPSLLEHHRPHDTHAPILFAPGCYKVHRQREHTPEGWRMVQD